MKSTWVMSFSASTSSSLRTGTSRVLNSSPRAKLSPRLCRLIQPDGRSGTYSGRVAAASPTAASMTTTLSSWRSWSAYSAIGSISSQRPRRWPRCCRIPSVQAPMFAPQSTTTGWSMPRSSRAASSVSLSSQPLPLPLPLSRLR